MIARYLRRLVPIDTQPLFHINVALYEDHTNNLAFYHYDIPWFSGYLWENHSIILYWLLCWIWYTAKHFIKLTIKESELINILHVSHVEIISKIKDAFQWHFTDFRKMEMLAQSVSHPYTTVDINDRYRTPTQNQTR